MGQLPTLATSAKRAEFYSITLNAFFSEPEIVQYPLLTKRVEMCEQGLSEHWL